MNIILNDDQLNALQNIKKSKNILISGQAGVGKSILIQKICEIINNYQILAPTGVAAINAGGITIHKFFSITPAIQTIQDYTNKKIKYFSKVPWKTLEYLIIDEVSMIQPSLFYLINSICQLHKNNLHPFGGIKLILVGDWYQLPPINKDSTLSETFIFETDLFKQMDFTNIQLTKVMRQSDEDFINQLSKIRIGDISDDSMFEFLGTLQKNIKQPKQHYIKLFAKNIGKKYANQTELDKLSGSSFTYTSKDTGNIKLLQNHLIEPIITLKVNSQVMLLWNMPEYGLCNGSIGTVTNCNTTNIIVDFNGKKIQIIPIKVEINMRQSNGEMKVAATRTQIPIALAYAITIHKSQGLTFDFMEIFCDGIFSPGQFYTALSRSRKSDNVILHDFEMSHIMVCNILKN